MTVRTNNRILFFLLVLTGIFLLLASVSFAVSDDKNTPVRFEIKNYQIDGNTLIPNDKIAAILAPFIGPRKDIETAQKAAKALQKAYRCRGYGAVRVVLPEQEIGNSVVRLKVIEPRVGKINIEGNRFFNAMNIRNSLPALHSDDPLNTDALSRSLKLANDNPAKKTNLELRNSDKENEVDANIKVKDEQFWKVGATFDNTGDARTGRYRQEFIFQHANISNRDQILALQYTTSPSKPDKVNIYGLSYRMPIYELGSSLDVIGFYSDVDSGTVDLASTGMQISGKGTVLGMHYNQNLPKIGSYDQKLTAGLDYRAYENSVMFEEVQLGNDVTVHPVSLTYAGIVSLDKASGGFYLGADHNLPGGWVANDSSTDFETARLGAPEKYTVFHYGANLSYFFPGDWQARMAMNGQYTNKPLVPGEQFGLGGANSIRGFREREFSNDRGYSGNVEIYTPNILKTAWSGKIQCRALVFYDAGHVSRVDPLPDETTGATVASIGPGLRITDGKNFSIAADVGVIVDPADGGRGRGDSLCHLRVSLTF
jgi:hemolysin activation/secretion protein